MTYNTNKNKNVYEYLLIIRLTVLSINLIYCFVLIFKTFHIKFKYIIGLTLMAQSKIKILIRIILYLLYDHR